MIATQTDMFEGEAAPVADLVPAAVLDELTAVERSYRTRLIDEGGTLARVMRTAEQTTLPSAQLVELWRWQARDGKTKLASLGGWPFVVLVGHWRLLPDSSLMLLLQDASARLA